MNEMIDATGDVVAGDVVFFKRATFTGSFRNPKFAGFEELFAIVEKDSYGQEKQQHTFSLTVLARNGDVVNEYARIKGRNLYREGCERFVWQDESARESATQEKHERGDSARKDRAIRREVQYSSEF